MQNSPICWVGGKRLLRKRILSLFPPHVCYVEVFGGAAWVLFGKDPSISQVEVLNDIDSELINFYEVVKYHPMDFIASFDWELVSRELFRKYKKELKKIKVHFIKLREPKNFSIFLKPVSAARWKFLAIQLLENPP